MSTKIAIASAMLALATLSGCSEPTEPPRATAAPQQSRSTPGSPAAQVPSAQRFVADDQDLVLNDDFVSPDASAPLVGDEDAEGLDDEGEYEHDLLTDSVDPLTDVDSPTAVEVALVSMPTTSFVITGRQLTYANAIRKRNERVYGRRVSPDVSEPSTTTPTTPPATTAESVPAAPLMEDKDIIAEKHGQWATSASASSIYGQPKQPNAPYAPLQVTGAPNVARYSDSPAAWTSKSGDSQDPEWLEVGFAKPVHATSIRIRQTAAPGAIARIDLIDAGHVAHLLWEGTDETPYPKNTIGWFVKDLPRTTYVVTGARITLLPARVWGYNEIDAVQLVGEE